MSELHVPKFAARNYCAPKSNDDGDDFIEPATETADKSTELDFPVVHSLPATVVVPEVWPHVPLIAVNRNPVFPRFIKLLEVRKSLRKVYCIRRTYIAFNAEL